MENIISAPDNQEFNEYGSIGELMIRQLKKNASKTLLVSSYRNDLQNQKQLNN